MSDEPFKGFRITSDPDTTNIEQPGQAAPREVQQLPLRLLLVSDLAPEETVTDWLSESRIKQVDKDSFDKLMMTMAPSLTLDVPNTLSDTPKQLELTMRFPDLGAFHPALVTSQVPALAQLVQVRALVVQVQKGSIDLDAFRADLDAIGADAAWADKLHEALAAPEPPPSAASASSDEDSTLDRLMGMVDMGDGSTPPASSGSEGGLMGALLDAVAGDSDATPKVEKAAADQLLADIDAAISTQVNAIMNQPAFRCLEAAWRGFKFLVDQIDFRKNIYLEVLAASKADLSTALYHQVLIPEHTGEVTKPPLTLIVLDMAFDNSSADLALLDDLADTGASLQAPILAAAGPAFFGVDDYAGVATLPPLRQLVERPEFIAWNKLRERKAARYLALALPAFLLRSPYGGDDGFKAFGFKEEGHLWGNATLAAAAAVARSFAQTNWPTHLTGNSRSTENLPLWKSRQGHTPLSVLIPDSKLAEFSKGGFVVVNGKANHDAIHVARAMSVCLPEAYEDLMAATEARIHVTLGCTLFVARAAQHLMAVQATLAPGLSVEQAQREVEAGMRMFFYTEGQTVPPDAVEVQAVDESGVDEQDLLAIRLKAPRYVLDRPVSLVMGLPLPKGG